MSLTLVNSPYITVYRNSLVYTFNNKIAVQTEFDIDNNDIYIITTLLYLNDNTTKVYNGNILTSIPTLKSEGFNQLDLSIVLPNGVYKIVSIEIKIGANTFDLIDSNNIMLDVNYHIPSINENMIRV